MSTTWRRLEHLKLLEQFVRPDLPPSHTCRSRDELVTVQDFVHKETCLQPLTRRARLRSRFGATCPHWFLRLTNLCSKRIFHHYIKPRTS